MTERRRSASILAIVAAAALCTLLAAVSAPAQTGEPYVVTVHVDVEGASAQAARETALADGQRTALRRLLRRLTLPADHSRLPEVAPARTEQLIDSVQLADERSSTVRYIADMTVRFKPDSIRRILEQARIDYVDSPSKPVVVLPIWHSGGDPVLWDDPNPWRMAWARRDPANGLIPMIVPLGGLEDLQQVGAREAFSGDREALSAIGSRYRAGEVLVAVADPARGTVTLDRFDVVTGEISTGGRYALPAVEAPEALGPLVDGIVRELETQWKQANVVPIGSSEEIEVRVPLATFDNWVQVRSRLEAINLIESVEVQSLSRSEALLRLSYLGDVSRLQSALRQRDLVLTSGASGSGAGVEAGQSWEIRLADTPTTGGAGVVAPAGTDAESDRPLPPEASGGGAAPPPTE